jgi:propanol-preferring alcohol dehydrogenase
MGALYSAQGENMKAAVLHRFGSPLAIEELRTPEPKGDEILVRVKGVGVCHSDLHISDGRYPNLPLPLVLGHEIGGEAEGIGEVLVYASWGCKSCALCSEGDEQLCVKAVEAGWVRDGGYADYVIVPSRRYLLPLDGLDPIRCAPLSDAGVTPYRVVRRVSGWLLKDGSTAVVLGVGALGQFAIQYLKLLTGAHVVAVDLNEGKLRRALELGADEAVLPENMTGSARAVLDFVGSDETLALAVRILERGGILAQVGEAGGKMPFGMGFVPHESFFTTSIWGSMQDLSAVLGYARGDKLDWQVETLPLEAVNEALTRLRKGDVLGRLVLTP